MECMRAVQPYVMYVAVRDVVLAQAAENSAVLRLS